VPAAFHLPVGFPPSRVPFFRVAFWGPAFLSFAVRPFGFPRLFSPPLKAFVRGPKLLLMILSPFYLACKLSFTAPFPGESFSGQRYFTQRTRAPPAALGAVFSLPPFPDRRIPFSNLSIVPPGSPRRFLFILVARSLFPGPHGVTGIPWLLFFLNVGGHPLFPFSHPVLWPRRSFWIQPRGLLFLCDAFLLESSFVFSVFFLDDRISFSSEAFLDLIFLGPL